MNPILALASEVYEERRRVRKLRLILISLALLVGWCTVVVFVLRTPKEDPQVHVSAPAVIPSSTSTPSGLGSTMPTMRPSSLTRRSISVQAPTPTSSVSNHSPVGGSSFTIHTTSSASPVFIGGGSNGGGGNTGGNSSHTNSSRVLAVNMPSTSAMIVSPALRLESRSLSTDNRLQDMQQVIEENGPSAVAARMKKDGWDDYGQDVEPFPDPIGDVAWPVMILLTTAWCVRVHRRRQQACK